ncbi:hypothetical protein SAMN04488502_101478 [Dendrosporobacter quercicolus]|uniref:Uncharacterized protein n=1 Tax=Dendrosporobacter quercicolus TaxID=146817 RepID=A0A1G9LVB0_9FIRM|nr:hypothetical protein [Dendrosporobacter quercicolus]SDL65833.1 hypothetical protein SAMN04488502_101478 [Dendrosporobacter quercicolus]
MSARWKNANGNMLDRVVCEEIKRLGADSSEFIRQLEFGKKQLEGNSEEYDDKLDQLRGAFKKNEKEIAEQVASLSLSEGTVAKGYVIEKIEELHGEGEKIKNHIAEIESLTTSHVLSNIEFDIIRQMLTTFRDTIDDMRVKSAPPYAPLLKRSFGTARMFMCIYLALMTAAVLNCLRMISFRRAAVDLLKMRRILLSR